MSSAMVCCQNPFSISHRCDTVTSRPTGWLDSDSAVMIDRLANCWQQGDNTIDQLCSHYAVLAVNNIDYTITVQSPCSHCAAKWLME